MEARQDRLLQIERELSDLYNSVHTITNTIDTANEQIARINIFLDELENKHMESTDSIEQVRDSIFDIDTSKFDGDTIFCNLDGVVTEIADDSEEDWEKIDEHYNDINAIVDEKLDELYAIVDSQKQNLNDINLKISNLENERSLL